MNKKPTDYIAGRCNIGATEIKRRRRVGVLNLIIAVILGYVLSREGVSTMWRFWVFFPLFCMFLGFIQSFMKFCSVFALSSVYKFGDDSDRSRNITDVAEHAKDVKKAWILISLSFVLSLALTYAFYQL